jgi:hypothetical protein
MAILRSKGVKGVVRITAKSNGLQPATAAVRLA